VKQRAEDGPLTHDHQAVLFGHDGLVHGPATASTQPLRQGTASGHVQPSLQGLRQWDLRCRWLGSTYLCR
jgi:hypothetical protein